MKHEDKKHHHHTGSCCSGPSSSEIEIAPAAPLLQKPHLLKNLLPVVQSVTHTVTAAVQIRLR